MDADAMQGWALAHGWAGKNPEGLAQYVRDINGGKRPRARHVLRSDYVDYLRQGWHRATIQTLRTKNRSQPRGSAYLVA
ncbi:hypothetical protein [Arthrobacter sp. ISL-28]|uniref:hypothetical protein n=1 Tax=Arthrobacter sp. ISL-28 TaxID=2819108 RepID=UPI001BEC0770|nr:hypothetical protein [Arthrobacter sp. ISL-28]MBT2523524.1 hypothetical protein [Arthrobacter sp. ISL-28]